MPEVLQRQFEATPGKGRVSACVQMPANAVATLVLGHGAGADMRHAHMQALADALAEAGIATLRFNFPFREAGVSRVTANRFASTPSQARWPLPASMIDPDWFSLEVIPSVDAWHRTTPWKRTRPLED